MGFFRFFTAGESHGRGLMAIIEGMVAGLALSEEFIWHDLERRQGGYGRGARMQIEKDRAELLSGVWQGLTTGSPIAMVIWNKDWENWRQVMSIVPSEGEREPLTRLRPGHADLPGVVKYGLDDVRPTVARRFLEEFEIEVYSHTLAIGGQWAKTGVSPEWDQVEESVVRCADREAEKRMIAAIDAAKEAGDTVGGVFEVVVTGLPIGLGSHVQWDRRLDARIAQAVMSIPAVKGVEFGLGFAQADLRGHEVHDVIQSSRVKTRRWQRATNRAGGMEGGMTSGQPVVVRAVIKPLSTLAHPLPSIDLRTGKEAPAHYERSDICIVPAAGVIGEAMLAIVLADAILEKFGGDSLKEIKCNYLGYCALPSEEGG
jgi:chorismate synthase